ncbi:hypothetical protein PCIT_a3741 [Pseudoalteromonas citrea]|uniref:S-methyl-5-thioribose kinase n=2 Tax=Pseudoalteromonas citrea TaxID=43655 RepID=A0AAD4AG64_9GAMM|nr:S-methyl-5-thioribose kinase [Pseudoalteromonas citrea]KAF7767676.1 hypothetical protein PCIT_a3741 [Pseudoalteromonas citrea]
MTQYSVFDSEKALGYVASLGSLFNLQAPLSCYEFGDGNLNLVFRISDSAGRSIILKQALPYARCVGESWPLTLDRARIEASVLKLHGVVCPETTVKVLHQNDQLALTILEDLGQLAILRTALNNGETYPKLSKDIATHLATTSFNYSDFVLTPAKKKSLVSEFLNPELCAITEELFFDDPYHQHERNDFPITLTEPVSALRNNAQLRLEVAKLKAKFLCSPQTLLHGDVHTGSIFVDANTTKVIDPEFGFFGPIGFDLGSFVGNLLLNYCAQQARIESLPQRRQMQTYLISCIAECLLTFEQSWQTLANTHTQDVTLRDPAYIDHFISSIMQDAMGYCGTELIRRTIGLAHVADIEGIEDKTARFAVEQHTLLLGEQLILNSSSCTSQKNTMQLLLSLLN